jgi:hypothetical protein
MLVSGLKGAASGFGRTVLAGQELLGRGVGMVAPQTGRAITQDAQQGLDKIDRELAPDQAAHPAVTFLGELAGGAVGPTAAAGKVAKLYNVSSEIAKAAIAGITSGVLTPVHQKQLTDLDTSIRDFAKEKLKQVAIGGAVGAAGGKVAQVVMDPAKKMLLAAGVKLTPGQIAGAAANKAEQKATAIPIVGHFISEARKDATHSFNDAAWNQALAPIGAKLPLGTAPGHASVQAVSDVLDKAYSAILPHVSLRVDPALKQDVGRVLQRVQSGVMPPDQKQQFAALVKNFVVPRFGRTGFMTGNTFKLMESELSRLAKNYGADPSAANRELGMAISDLRGALRDTVTRQNPNLAPELQKVNTAYALAKPLQRAAADAKLQEGVFTPGQALRRIAANDGSRDKIRFAKGLVPMQKFAEAAQKVVGNTVPSSGTSERMMLAHMLGGGLASTHPAAAGAAALGSAAYSRPGAAAIRGVSQALPQTRSLIARTLAGAAPQAVADQSDKGQQ